MDVYVTQYRRNGHSDPLGVYSSWEKAEEETDNHAASVFKITAVRSRQWIGDDLLTIAYGNLDQRLIVNYKISRFTLDAETLKPEPSPV